MSKFSTKLDEIRSVIPNSLKLWMSFASTAIFMSLLLLPNTDVFASDKVRVQFDDYHQLRFAGFYSALWNETYSNAGLDVELIPSNSQADPDDVIDSVIRGEADFGVASIDLLKAYGEGKPIVAFSTFFQTSDITLFVRENTLVSTVNDIAKLRLTAPPGTKYSLALESLLLQANQDANIHFDYKVSDTPLLDLKRGVTDMIVGSSLTTPYIAESMDLVVKEIPLPKYGLNLPGLTLFSSREYYSKHNHVADKFVLSTRKGWQNALENTDDLAIELTRRIFSQNNTYATFGMSFFQADQLHRLAMYPVVAPGAISVDRWKHNYELIKPLIGTAKAFNTDFVYDPVKELQYKAELWRNIIKIGAPLLLGLLSIAVWYQRLKRSNFLKHQAELHRQATYDSLTGLPNRVYAFRELDEWIQQIQASGRKFYVLFLDLDGFKVVNDTLSHSVGDKLLVEVSNRLQSSVPEKALLSRIGGDEFLILHEAQNEFEILAVADAILEILKAPFNIKDMEVLVGASIGVACYPQHGDNSQLLITHADEAMYEAKRLGKNISVVYTEEMGLRAKEKLDIANHLRNAIKLDELYLCYQPITCSHTGEIIGAEALLRWNNPILGMIPPDQFIPIAEETGNIDEIGFWVLETALSKMQQWNENSQRNIYVSVNVSPRQFQDASLVEKVVEKLSLRNIRPELLKLEITESLLVNDTPEISNLLSDLSHAGIDIFMDDFGTGYSSLSYLKKFPIDVIKIDKGFINEVTTDKKNESLVKAIVELAKGLDMKIVCEGVETGDQLELLNKLSCDYIQGYLISKPLEYDDFVEFVANNAKYPQEQKKAS